MQTIYVKSHPMGCDFGKIASDEIVWDSTCICTVPIEPILPAFNIVSG